MLVGMDRKARILHKIDVQGGSGLELGPLTTPIVTKDEGRIFYVDHMSTADLRKKYANEPVELDQIVTVDYVLGNNTLKKVVGTKKFNYIIASHVIEHVPDVVSWLQEIASILKPNGILALAIPDKRFTFDITRQDSRPADIIGAYVDKHTRASSAGMYDFAIEYRQKINAQEVVDNKYRDFSKKPKRYTPKEAWDMTLKNAAEKEYVDSHCHVFTPYSFFEIVKALIEHDLFDFEVADFHDTANHEIEFVVSLKKISKKDRRLQLKSVPKLPSPKRNYELEERIDELEKQLHNVLTSHSWRVTKPMRKVINKAKRQK